MSQATQGSHRVRLAFRSGAGTFNSTRLRKVLCDKSRTTGHPPRLVLQLGARAAGERRPGRAAVEWRVLVQRRERARRLSLRLGVARGRGVLAVGGVRLGLCRGQTAHSRQPPAVL